MHQIHVNRLIEHISKRIHLIKVSYHHFRINTLESILPDLD